MAELLAGEKIAGESKSAVLACNDWLRMGAGRSLVALVQRYAEIYQDIPPTKSLATLKVWSQRFDWQMRAEIYDKAIDEQRTAQTDARRQAILDSGLANDFERVNELNEIYDRLKLEFVQNGLWYTDIKLSARGDTVDVQVFNKPLIDSMRATLDDIAKEVGGRKQKSEIEHSGTLTTKVIEGPNDVR